MMKTLTIALVILIAIVVLVLINDGDIDTLPSISTSPSTGSPSPTATGEANIIVTSPKSGDKVTSPITVTGRARVFENSFSFALRDSQGNKLYESFAMANAPDIGQYGDFNVKIPVPANAPKNLFVEVFDYSAKDGTVENLVRVPVELSVTQTMVLKAFYGNSKLDPQTSCNKAFPVSRTVLSTQEVGYMSLIELLKGPTDSEKAAGYFTSIPKNVRINSLSIRNGTAYADFDETLQLEVGGSCRVAAIRAEITETLKQFPSVKNVVISINGRTDDILQP